MKQRFIIILAGLFASLSLQAQVRQQTYGDTMFARLASFYYVPWWILDDWCNLSSDTDNVYYTTRLYPQSPFMGDIVGPDRHGEFLHYHSDTPLEITGIAISGFNRNYTDPETNGFFSDTSRRQEYLVLWQQEGDTAYIRGELEWAVADPHRYLALTFLDDDGYSCANNFWDTAVVPIYEYYFDKPIHVTGDFYVGTTNRSSYVSWEEHTTSPIEATSTQCYSMNCLRYYNPEINQGNSCPSRQFRYLVFSKNWMTGTELFAFRTSREMALTFPLYNPKPTIPDNFTCARPTGLRLDDMTPRDGVAYISWDDLEHHTSWDVALGDTLFETIRHELLPLTGLRQGETYSVAVRAHCQFSDTLFYSDWSDTLTFTLNDDGIREISDSRGQISVFPNPTTGDVTIDCGKLKVERIELLDLQGRVLMREEHSLFPNPYTLSLKDVPTGTYLIRIHTAEGPFTRRVVKE